MSCFRCDGEFGEGNEMYSFGNPINNGEDGSVVIGSG